jgi:uncharacterized membrane protein HdeD (DUF308 family)
LGKEGNKGHGLGHEIGLGITVLRGLLLLALGLSLLLIPDRTYRMLFNAMGVFWLMTGIVLIRREAHARGNRLLLVAAICGVLAGLLVLGRDLSRQWLAEPWVKGLLGGAILLSGVLHILAQSRFGWQALRGRPLVNALLGLVEIVLGVLLIVTPTGREQIVFNIAIIWSLLAGGLLLVGTILQWLRERRQQHPDQAAEQSGEET